MQPITLVRGLVHMIELKKLQNADPDRLYAQGLYVPLITASVIAPGMFLILGGLVFIAAGIVQFYPAYELPTDLLVTLGGVSWFLAAISFGAYNFILKKVLQLDTSGDDDPGPAMSFRESLQYSIEPILSQLKSEQKKMF